MRKYGSGDKTTKRFVRKETKSPLIKLDYQCWLIGENKQLWTDEINSGGRNGKYQAAVASKLGKMQADIERVPNQNRRVPECLQ